MPHRTKCHCVDRHHFAYRHRQKKRHHDDRFRAGGRAYRRKKTGGRHLPGLPATFPADHDDDDGGAPRSVAVGAGIGSRIRVAAAIGDRHRRRIDLQSVAHALHDAGGVSLSRPPPALVPAQAETANGASTGHGLRNSSLLIMTRRIAYDNFLALPRRERTIGKGGTHESYPTPVPKSGAGKLDVSSKTKNQLLSGAIVMLLFLASCTVGPNYVKPTVEVPGAYRENAGWQVAQPQDATLRGNWWEMFNEPQLNAFEEQVDISNQNVALAEAQYRQARALVQQARAAYFPTVTIGASLNNSSQPPSSRNNNGSSNGASGRTAPTLSTIAFDASGAID